MFITSDPPPPYYEIFHIFYFFFEPFPKCWLLFQLIQNRVGAYDDVQQHGGAGHVERE